MKPELWLFDIDGTLLDTGGAGLRSLQEAAESCFGHRGPPLDLAGSTDLGVLSRILGHSSSPTDEAERFFATYVQRLEWNLKHGGFTGRVLPGAEELLAVLEQCPRTTIGLLTGNTAEGAATKMRHFGLDRYFRFGAYGCDFADRNLLGPLALERAAAHTGKPFLPPRVLVVGDTPKDIACARAVGARCLAVATGAFSASELRAAGADKVVDSLLEVNVAV